MRAKDFKLGKPTRLQHLAQVAVMQAIVEIHWPTEKDRHLFQDEWVDGRKLENGAFDLQCEQAAERVIEAFEILTPSLRMPVFQALDRAMQCTMWLGEWPAHSWKLRRVRNHNRRLFEVLEEGRR